MEEPAVPRRFGPYGDPIAWAQRQGPPSRRADGENATFPPTCDSGQNGTEGKNSAKDHKEDVRRLMTARSIVQELIRYVDPPHGTAIVVNEAPSTKPDDPNWIEYPAVMGATRRRLLTEKAAELRRSHPLIDWSVGDGTRD